MILCQARMAVPKSATCVDLAGSSMLWLPRFQVAAVGVLCWAPVVQHMLQLCSAGGCLQSSLCDLDCPLVLTPSSVCDLCNSPVSGVLC
jgi:hypothetical protein